MILLFIASEFYLVNSTYKTEKAESVEKLKMIERFVFEKLNDLNKLNKDWAWWDDTYNFIKQRNRSYIQSNLTDETFDNIRLNLIVFFDQKGDLVYYKHYNLDSAAEISSGTVNSRVTAALSKYAIISEKDTLISELDNVEGRPVLVSSLRVLKSDSKGDHVGTLVMCKIIDETFLKDISTVFGKKITISESKKEKSIPFFSAENKYLLYDKSSDKLEAYLVLKNTSAQEKGILRTELDREITTDQLHLIQHFLTATIIICSILGIVIIVLIKRLVVDQIIDLKKQLRRIKFDDSISGYIRHKGNDEISELAEAINQTLQELEHTLLLNQAAQNRIKLQITALESAANGILISDKEGKIIWINNAFSKLTGYSDEEVLGNNCRLLNSGKHEPEFFQNLWNTILSGNVWRGEIINKRKDGTIYDEEMTITPVQTQGNIKYFIAIKEDITERIRYEKEMIKARDEAEKSNRLKTEFLAQISHEIRTPVNTILNFLTLLKMNMINPEENEEDFIETSFEMIDNGSRRLIRTIDLLLDISMLQSGNYELSKKEIELVQDIIRPLIDEFSYSAEKKGLKLILKSDDTKKYNLHQDSYILTQMINNLIDNAIKYTIAGQVTVCIIEEDNQIIIKIIDTGVGISEDFMNRMFTPFSQESQGYTRVYEGNGLGLSLVKKYADLIGATIDVSSKKNSGTTFSIFLDLN